MWCSSGSDMITTDPMTNHSFSNFPLQVLTETAILVSGEQEIGATKPVKHERITSSRD